MLILYLQDTCNASGKLGWNHINHSARGAVSIPPPATPDGTFKVSRPPND
jgi:hypothetical protein